MSGLDVHDALIERDAELPIIYMSGHADVPLAVQAMQKGAVTLLEKPFDEAMLEEALEQRVPSRARPRMASDAGDGAAADATAAADPAAAGEPSPPTWPRARVRAREADSRRASARCSSFVIQGIYNKNIADRIGLSIKTVELYRARGMAKMQARSVAELTRMMVTRQV